MFNRRPDLKFLRYYIYIRPYLNDFLVECSKLFNVAIWSSGGDIYVDWIVKNTIKNLIPLEFVWGKSRCTQRLAQDKSGVIYIKNLKKVKRKGYSLRKMLIIENDSDKVANYGNSICVEDYRGGRGDEELLLLKKYLKTLHDVENVRRIEKRDWRRKALELQ
jgi:RNA polymerase II subunit A small phosphatase-like protein